MRHLIEQRIAEAKANRQMAKGNVAAAITRAGRETSAVEEAYWHGKIEAFNQVLDMLKEEEKEQ